MGAIKLFKSNVKSVKYLNVSEWTIRSYKKSPKFYKDRYKIPTPYDSDILTSSSFHYF